MFLLAGLLEAFGSDSAADRVSVDVFQQQVLWALRPLRPELKPLARLEGLADSRVQGDSQLLAAVMPKRRAQRVPGQAADWAVKGCHWRPS